MNVFRATKHYFTFLFIDQFYVMYILTTYVSYTMYMPGIFGCPEAGLINGCELQCEGLELNLGPLGKQTVF